MRDPYESWENQYLDEGADMEGADEVKTTAEEADLIAASMFIEAEERYSSEF